MFASVIQYRLNPIFEEDFIRYWTNYRNYLRENQLISTAVLHRESKISFLAYFRWNSRMAFEKSILMPEAGIRPFQANLDECCNSIKVLHRMETISQITDNE